MFVWFILSKDHKIISFLLRGNKSSSTPINTAKSPKHLEKKPTPHHDIPAHFYVRDTTVPDRSAE
jgi:hypothetical protein